MLEALTSVLVGKCTKDTSANSCKNTHSILVHIWEFSANKMPLKQEMQLEYLSVKIENIEDNQKYFQCDC